MRGETAYEFKLRVTIAASGQGRWGEELDFPADCVDSGFVPALVVFDPTDNPKLRELKRAFEDAGGSAFIGAEAWHHLESQAGQTMALFLERYLRRPLADLLGARPSRLGTLRLEMQADAVVFRIGTASFTVDRSDGGDVSDDDELPEDASDALPGI
ncbi:MAG: hypothetical protein WBF71_02940 [Microthrixaceae bacterium]